MSNRQFQAPTEQIAEFCERHHIRKLSLFGSALGADFRPDSDVDVLVEFEAGHISRFFRLFDLGEGLSQLFGGRKVDLRAPQDLSRYFRDEVIAHAEVRHVRE
ncbi:MAG: nucleotidyltransferase family protein [Terriglobia bacterium]